MSLKRIFAAAAAGILTLSLTGCFGFGQQPKAENGMKNYDFREMDTDYIQLKPPSAGDKIAVITTDLGEMRVVLYEEYAPKTVANFINHAEAGDYDNIPIKGVSKNVYFLTGGREDEKGNYTGRDSDEELLENEYNVNLWPFCGALLSFSEKSGKSDARWFMINIDEESLTEEAILDLKDSVKDKEDEVEREKLLDMFDTFYRVGGVFGLAGENTVFGQTYLGLDVLKELTRLDADEKGVASETVLIKSVTIGEFKEGDKTDEYPRPPLHDTPVSAPEESDVSDSSDESGQSE